MVIRPAPATARARRSGGSPPRGGPASRDALDAATAAGVCQATATPRSQAMKASERGSSRWRCRPAATRSTSLGGEAFLASPSQRHGAPSTTSAGTMMARSENWSACAYSVRRATAESGGTSTTASATSAASRHQPRHRAAGSRGRRVAAPSLTSWAGAGRSPRAARGTGSRGVWRRSVPGFRLHRP